MNRLGLVVGLLAGAAGPSGAGSPDPKTLAIPAEDLDKARVLVRVLGSEAFRDRERAERELAEMGRRARPILAAAAGTDPNPEVRARAGRLLPAAEAADLQARVDTFLADADGQFAHDLPGLDLFRKHVGTDKPARELYAEVARGRPNLDLLAAAGGTPEEAGKAVADRRVGLYLAQHPGNFNRFPGAVAKPQFPSLADVSALLLAETVVPAGDIPRPGQFQFITAATFLTTPAPSAAVSNPATPHAAAFRSVLVKWLDSRTAPTDLDQIGWVAQTFKQIPETTTLLRRMVTTPGVQGWSKGQAVGYLVARGGKDERPFLRSLLKDETLVATIFLGGNNGQPANAANCQLRDLALAVLVLQDGGKLKDYGFDVQPGSVANLQNIQNGGGANFAFATAEKRDAAHKKWAAAQLPPAEPVGPPRPVERK